MRFLNRLALLSVFSLHASACESEPPRVLVERLDARIASLNSLIDDQSRSIAQLRAQVDRCVVPSGAPSAVQPTVQPVRPVNSRQAADAGVSR